MATFRRQKGGLFQMKCQSGFERSPTKIWNQRSCLGVNNAGKIAECGEKVEG